jgi:hypothetical protein
LLRLKASLPDINPATIQVQFGKWRQFYNGSK